MTISLQLKFYWQKVIKHATSGTIKWGCKKAITTELNVSIPQKS